MDCRDYKNVTKNILILYYYFTFIFFQVTSYKNFSRICANIRFDSREKRDIMRKDAPISLVWESFIDNCQKNYNPGEYLTVDEQLCNTKGRVSFRTYIPTKPGKYGIKIWCLADSKTSYLSNAQIYTGKSGNKSEDNQGERIVRQLAEPFLDKRRTITTDDFFTGMSLAKYLRTRKTGLIGTVRKSRRFLPSKINEKSRELGSFFIYHDDITLVRFSDKPGKYVLLLSSQHQFGEIEENNKPEIVNCYNETKAGVDTLDQIVRFYTTKRKTNRWPLTIFYNILDIAAFNSLILYTTKYPEFAAKNKTRTRREFMKLLIEEIAEKYSDTLDSNQDIEPMPKLEKKIRCYICPRDKDRKTKSVCNHCEVPICTEHSLSVCKNCYLNVL